MGGKQTTVGQYGEWLRAILGDEPGELSFRRDSFDDVDAWRTTARERVFERMAPPTLPPIEHVELVRSETYDGVSIEYMRWQNPFGPDTEAVFLKPEGATKRLPAVLGLHDHSGHKFYGWQKIARGVASPPPLMAELHTQAYGGRCWANELAKRGYAVLVHDAFAFGSRRVHVADVIEPVRDKSNTPEEPTTPEEIRAYNAWAAAHEHIMAKACFSAGTTWPGIFFAEDRRALDYLTSRPDVDPTRIACGGLSGGGLRTVFLGGLDDRIRAAFCVGMMTTWRDFALWKNYTHTWMCYVPILPRELDYPEILALRVPKPTFVLSNIDDPLFSLDEMRRADAILRAVYEKAGKPEAYRCEFYPGPHKFDLPMQRDAFEWLDDQMG